MPPAPFAVADPDYARRIRESFSRQGVMGLIGAEIDAISSGRCVLSLPWRSDLTQQNGFFHAGVVSTLLDSAAGYAGYTLMPAESGVLSVEFKINLLNPADGPRLIAEGEVIKAGRNLVITRAEGYIERNNERVHCASMQQTLMTMHGRPA